MKTLVNKENPAIRITAPEIEVHEEEDMYFIPVSDYCIPMCIDDWTLVEEQQPEEICSKCIHDRKDDDYCRNLHGKRWINGNGVYKCTEFCEKETKRKQSLALKKIVDNLSEEKLAKTRAEMKLEDAAEPVDLEKEIRKHTDLFQADIEYPLRLTAIKFYELGRKGGSK